MRKFEVVSNKHRKHPEIEIQLPKRGSKHSVAYDFFSPVNTVLDPFKPTVIMTDIKAKFGEDEALLLSVRSSMGKVPIMMANSQGWVESDYNSNPDNDGNLGFMLLNLSNKPYEIKVGDRIGQGMFIKYLTAENGNVDDDRIGGFGSTGK